MPNGIHNIWSHALSLISKWIALFRKTIENSCLVRKIASYPTGERFLNDTIFRSVVFLYFSLILNFLYRVEQFLAGIYERSVWLGALAVYHILLAVMQFRLSSHVNKHDNRRDDLAELRQYRFCGAVLLMMTPVFASILVLIVHKNSRAGYPGFLIYFAAIFAFAKIGTAISSAIKFQTYGSPILSAAKTLSLIAAMISILSLETAVLSRYGSMQDPVFYQGMLGTVGGAVCVFTLCKAVSMIIQATQQLKALKRSRQG